MAILLLERERADDAWRAVAEIKSMDEEAIDGRYRSQVRGAPAMIQRNGLGQFFAFLAAKGFTGGTEYATKHADKANALLYQHLGRWLLGALRLSDPVPDRAKVLPGGGPQSDPLGFLMDSKCDLEQTLHATNEAVAWLQWARRFAESQLRTTSSDNED